MLYCLLTQCFFYFATARVHWRFSCVEKMFHPQQPVLRLESTRWIDTTNRHCLGENLWYYLLSAHKMKNRERSNWSTTHLWWPCPNVCTDSSRGPNCCKCTHRWILTGITRQSIEYKHPLRCSVSMQYHMSSENNHVRSGPHHFVLRRYIQGCT